jgi:hypothetical protein
MSTESPTGCNLKSGPTLHLSGKKKYLEYVSSLVVLDSPAEAPEYGRHLVRVEEREQTVQQHLQLHRNSVETLP